MHDGLQQQATGRNFPQRRTQTPKVFRQCLKLPRLAIHRALPQQAIAEHDLRLRRPLGIGRITAHQQQFGGLFMGAVKHPLADPVQAGHVLQNDLSQFIWCFCLLQIDLQLSGMRLDPALAFQLLGLGLQFGDGACQITGFVVQVGVRNGLVELPGGQLIHRHPHSVERIADRVAGTHCY